MSFLIWAQKCSVFVFDGLDDHPESDTWIFLSPHRRNVSHFYRIFIAFFCILSHFFCIIAFFTFFAFYCIFRIFFWKISKIGLNSNLLLGIFVNMKKNVQKSKNFKIRKNFFSSCWGSKCSGGPRADKFSDLGPKMLRFCFQWFGWPPGIWL